MRKIGYLLFGIVISGIFLVSGCEMNEEKSSDYESESTVMSVAVDETLNESINCIDIQWINGNITFEQTESDYIRMIQEVDNQIKKPDWMTWDIENGQLIICDNNDKKMGFTHGTNLIIYLPNNNYEEITVQTTNGVVAGSDIYTNNLQIATTNGEINLETSFDTADLETTNCSIRLSCQTMPEQIEMDSTNGAAVVLLPENDGFTFSTNSDEFKSDFELLQGEKNWIYQNGESTITVNTTNGSISLLKH